MSFNDMYPSDMMEHAFEDIQITIPEGWMQNEMTPLEMLNAAIGMANTLTEAIIVGDISQDDVYSVIFPDQIQGFSDGAVSFPYALATFNDYLSTLPPTPAVPDIESTLTPSPTIDSAPDLTDIVIEDFLGTAPELNFGAVPEYTEISAPSTPTIESPYTPERPEITYPSLPVLFDITLPTPTAVEIPLFTAVFEDDELLAPSYQFNYSEPEYYSTLKNLIYNQFMDEIENGGYGLHPHDEADLWNRERDRENVNAQVAIDEVRRNYAMSGFTLPPGALNKALERATLVTLQKNSSVNRDISIKRADLYWEGKKFVLQNSIQLEQLLMNIFNARWERALNAAKAQVEMAVAIYNAQIARYNAKVAKYRAEAEIFESRIRAEIAKVEIFKAQIEGAKVQSELQKNQVLLYSAQVDGVKSVIEAYKTDVEAANLMMKREELRMGVFKAEVEAYSARVAAEKYRFDAYESRVKGELGRVQAYEAQARAYAALMEGRRAQVEVNKLRLEQWVEETKAAIEIYKAQVAENAEIREVDLKLFDAEIKGYEADINRFNAQVNGLVKVYDLGQSALEREYRIVIAALQANIETSKLQLQRLLGLLDSQTKLSMGQMEASARIQSAAMNMMNFNISQGQHYSRSQSISESKSISWNTSQSQSYSYSLSTIWSFNHNWNHQED